MLYHFLKITVLFLGLAIFVLLSVAYYVLLERQVLGHVHRRQGPAVIGFFGVLQAVADGVKLLIKESLFPKNINFIIFILAPVFTFGLALANWVVIPFGNGWAVADFNLGALYLIAISSLSVHSIIMAGWSSNSKYAFLGALRSAAQMISYEIALGLTILSTLFLSRSLNLNDIVMAQTDIWYMFPLFPMFLIFLICILAETNRHPFDLPEAEAELVSGYNVEYSGVGFTLFFLGEYSNIILMSVLGTILFLGGWNLFLFFFIPSIFIFAIKTLFIMIFFLIIRGTLPRYRYDQLMRLGWKIYLPITLCFIVLLVIFIICKGSFII